MDEGVQKNKMEVNGKDTRIIELHCNGKTARLRYVWATQMDELAKEKPTVIGFDDQMELGAVIEILKALEKQVKRTGNTDWGEDKDDVCSSRALYGDIFCDNGYLLHYKRRI